MRGSYPYSGDSSICLAAIHCGVINATLGGSVFISRFYRQDWTGGDTQSIFPYNSSLGTSSNGVLSLDVLPSTYTVPSNGSEFSFIVRGRGELVKQRRQAPFTPRWGHAHVAFPLYFSDSVPSTVTREPYRNYHIIVGGYNGTAYLNDAWLAEPSDLNDSASDVQWQQLPSAPFSPRSDMRTLIIPEPANYSTGHQLVHVIFIGGQTAHRCGLVELGVCSNEVWDLQLNLNFSHSNLRLFHLTSVMWTPRPSGVLPFPARCGAALTALNYAGTVALVAGQLSYEDDNCTQAPTSLNEVWLNDQQPSLNFSLWRRDSDAPFSRRRSMQREDSLATTSIRATTMPSAQQGCCPLVGGFSIVNLTQTQTLGALEMYADAWVCNANNTVWSAPTCTWGWLPSASSDVPSVPTTSVPLPTAFAGSATTRSSWALAVQRFTGFTSAVAVAEWIQNLNPSQSSFNWSAMLRNPPDSSSPPSDAEIAQQRFFLPLAFIVLADQLGSNITDSVWVQSHQPWISPPPALYRTDVVLPSLSTVHPQSFNLAVGPDEASPFLPQSASSSNTSRPRFRFPLARLEPSYDEWMSPIYDPTRVDSLLYTVGSSIVSGGRSSSGPLNDWIQLGETRCLPPDDPSFLSVLGPIQLVSASLSERNVADVSFGQKELVQVQCLPTFRFEPLPLRGAQQTTFTCAPNGLWLDDELLMPRPCVQNPPLNCSAGLVDLGGEFCEPPRPSVTSIAAFVSLSNGMESEVDRRNLITLVNFPVTPDTPLRIEGSNFTLPLTVTVGGHRCDFAQLTGRVEQVCYNHSTCSSSGPQTVTTCTEFGSAISCVAPAVMGLNLPVLVESGSSAFNAKVADGNVATVSSPAPVITWLRAYTGSYDNGTDRVCQWSSDDLRLWDCPVQQSFNLSVCLDTHSVSQLSLSVYLGASYVSLPCAPESERSSGVILGYRCLRCSVSPLLGIQEVRVQPEGLPLLSRTNASISSSSCPPGYWTDVQAVLNNTGTDLCLPCPPGHSTLGNGGAFACTACRAGEYAADHNSSVCTPCKPGFYAPDPEAQLCLQCPVNSFQTQAGASGCTPCIDSYVVYDGVGRATGKCWECPVGAKCNMSSGAITAEPATFLVVDQARATVSSFGCSPSACLGASTESSYTQALTINASGVIVQNYCAAGRHPAYTPNWRGIEGLQDTQGVNVLCARCLAGHTEVNGECISCEAANAGLVIAILLALLAIVYLLHRLQRGRREKATVVVLGYFMQQSALFLAPPFYFVGLLNPDPLGGTTRRWSRVGDRGDTWHPSFCTLPMQSDADRLVAALVLQLVILAMPAFVGLVQLGCFLALRRWRQLPSVMRRAYTAVFMTPAPEPPRLPGSEIMLLAPLHLASDREAWSPERAPRAHRDVPLQTDASYSEAKEFSDQSSLAAVWNAAWPLYLRTGVTALLLSYTSISLLTLRFFHTRPVGVYGRRVADYPGLNPSSAVYTTWLLPIMMTLLVLVVLLPLLLAMLLRTLRQRRGSVALQVVAGGEGRDGNGQAVTSWDEVLQFQLCAMFKDECWWIAPFITARRLMLTAVVAFAPSESVFMWLTLVNNLLLAFHLQLQPFKREQDNALESVSLLLLSIQTSLLSAIPEAESDGTLITTLYFLSLIPILLALFGNWARTRWTEFHNRFQHT